METRNDMQRIPRITFKPIFPVRGIVSGAVGGLSAVVLLQQFAVLFPSLAIVLIGVIGGAVLVVVLANVARSITTSRLNRRLAAAEAQLGGVSPAAPAATATAATAASSATHLVPASGLPSYGEPDPTLTPAYAFQPGTPVEVVERRGDWAQIRSADGAVGWVNGTVLEPVGV